MKNSSAKMECSLRDNETSNAGSNFRVLMVEDDPNYRIFVRRLLMQTQQPAFSFSGVGSLEECKKYLSEEIADVVLLDLTLPDSGGESTITKVSEICAGAPIIVLTARDDLNFGLAAVGLGAQDYLVKHQISNDGLIRCIRYAIERKKFEESKIRLAAIRDFISTLAHDLQVPLVGANNVMEALLSGSFGALNPEQANIINTLRSSNGKQLQLVHKLLDLYKYELDSPGINFEPLDIRSLVQDCVGVATQKSSQAIEVILPDQIPLMRGDKQALAKMLENLLQNAIDFGDNQKRVELRVELKGQKLSIHVHNFGTPIPQEVRNGMFERFWLGVPGKTYVAHTGIGLYLCHRIASLHRGRLACQSSEADGTTMTVRLPIV